MSNDYKFNIGDKVHVKGTPGYNPDKTVTDRWYSIFNKGNMYELDHITNLLEDHLEAAVGTPKTVPSGADGARSAPSLQLGDIVETGDGSKYVFVPYMESWTGSEVERINDLHKGVLVNHAGLGNDEKNLGFMCLSEYDDDLMIKGRDKTYYHEDFDIMKVFRPRDFFDMFKFDEERDDGEAAEVIWTREPKVAKVEVTEKELKQMCQNYFGNDWLSYLGQDYYGDDYVDVEDNCIIIKQ